MRLPDIPERHRRLTRIIAAAGTGALALVRRRDFAQEHEPAARLANAIASTGLTWLSGTLAFAGRIGDEFDPGELFGAFGADAGIPARYSTVNESAEEDEAAKVQAFLNATTAAASGVISWTLWNPTQNIADAIDARLPAGLGRGLGAAASGSLVAVCAAVIDRFEVQSDVDEIDFAPVEVGLPDQIRECVHRLLDQPHPLSQRSAETVRRQFDSARFFVDVSYPRRHHPGESPIVLDDRQLAELLTDVDFSFIDVYPATAEDTTIPATQTYPVSAVHNGLELRLEISAGCLRRITFDEPFPAESLLFSEDLPSGTGPGTLHPNGLEEHSEEAGYQSRIEITDDEDETALGTVWPNPADLTFRTDRE
ncbi:hypothetical protein [Brevibacterium sp. UCMA 11754]|uniref:hypothetical protein n=1 Tax=Brevibacterium sp. UCMA 11754 TaxID=2749198 RepID=UPI001F3AE77A|nr:hypothetical protein [Brevibacterium sp. UCMA 11754]MCF2571592.1 hypothetical protein [Brevibacterium sp. UCMA 11754]